MIGLRRRTLTFSLLGAALTVVVVGCGQAGGSFDPRGPCIADGRTAGAYPDLERRLPASLGAAAPPTGDSGRSGTPGALGTYASHGVGELRYAGSTWDEGSGNATAIVILTTPAAQPAMQQDWVEEFYLAGARASTKTENIEKRHETMDGLDVFRIETLNDLSFQTVLVWSEAPGEVHVVIAATRVEPDASRDEHEARVAAAFAASRVAAA